MSWEENAYLFEQAFGSTALENSAGVFDRHIPKEVLKGVRKTREGRQIFKGVLYYKNKISTGEM